MAVDLVFLPRLFIGRKKAPTAAQFKYNAPWSTHQKMNELTIKWHALWTDKYQNEKCPSESVIF
jgi:hypothetical protein